MSESGSHFFFFLCVGGGGGGKSLYELVSVVGACCDKLHFTIYVFTILAHFSHTRVCACVCVDCS